MSADIASGFSTSLLETAIFFVILAVALFFWIGSSLRRAREEQEKRDARAEEHYHSLLSNSGLSESEKELIRRMGNHLRNPRERYRLLLDHGTFNSAASALIEEEESVSPASISALRMQLGFSGTPTGIAPRSTTEIPPGAEILIERARQEPVTGFVLSHSTSAMMVTLAASDNRFFPGTAVRVTWHTEGGVFSFDCTIFSSDGETLELSHAEGGDHVQRRDHFRRALRLPATITPLLDPEGSVSSEFVELGGNGGTLFNREDRFGPGEEVELTFNPDRESRITVRANVTRTSGEETLLHVRFMNIREGDRDRIYRLLFER